jgi:tetratricopeptide (TPR) repeat protein
MADRSRRLLAGVALSALAALPLAGVAQTQKYYHPPKILALGTHAMAVAGTGVVQIKVFVKKDGSVTTAQVVKSTNHADDAAALEIAKSSRYRAGSLDAKPGDFFYTISLKFNGTAVTSGDLAAGGGELPQATALIRGGKYTEAKTEIGAYLTAHPDDKGAQALLGVADGYLDDTAGAVAAFDAAGTIPANFRVVAAKAYADAAVAALKSKQNDQAIALSEKALALQENVNTLFIQGTAYANAQRYPEAIADLEKAKAMAVAGKAEAVTLNAIDSSLATAYVFGGQPDKGVALAQELRRRDPANTRIDDTLAAYYNQQAAAAMKAGKPDQAVALLESGAAALPKRAVVLYVQAANVLAQGQTPDWKRVKAEADKALAIDPNDARANYVAGIALANAGDRTGPLPYLQKAKANAGSDTQLVTDIDTALKKLGQK